LRRLAKLNQHKRNAAQLRMAAPFQTSPPSESAEKGSVDFLDVHDERASVALVLDVMFKPLLVSDAETLRGCFFAHYLIELIGFLRFPRRKSTCRMSVDW
jgi:hypothetical protein